MPGFRSYAVIAFFFASLGLLQSCSEPANRQAEPVFRKIPEIQEIRPEKSVKIKLKRNAKDDYSWEISGDDVHEVVNADKQLRKGLKTE